MSEQNRTNKITVRFNQDELDFIDKNGGNYSAFLRELVKKEMNKTRLEESIKEDMFELFHEFKNDIEITSIEREKNLLELMVGVLENQSESYKKLSAQEEFNQKLGKAINSIFDSIKELKAKE